MDRFLTTACREPLQRRRHPQMRTQKVAQGYAAAARKTSGHPAR
jgi:hypothetical protein